MSECVCGGWGRVGVSAGSMCVSLRCVCVTVCVTVCVWVPCHCVCVCVCVCVFRRTMPLIGMPAQSTRIPPVVDGLSKYYYGVLRPDNQCRGNIRATVDGEGWVHSVPTGPSAVSNFSVKFSLLRVVAEP